MPDYPYIVLLFFLLLLALAELLKPSESKVFFSLACIFVFVFMAFRAPVVGADTWGYYKLAMGQQSSDYAEINKTEPLFVLYCSFFANFCRIGLIYMVVNTLLMFWPLHYILKKYVKYKTVGVLAFFIFFNYISFFVALRQVLALSILLLGVIYVLKDKRRKWLTFLLATVVAFFVHKTSAITAFIFIICYFINLKKRIYAIGAIAITAVAGIVLNSFDPMSLFNLVLNNVYGDGMSKYTGFMLDELEESTLSIGTFINSSIGLFCFLFIEEHKINHWFSKIYLAGIMMYNLFKSVQMVDRMLFPCLLFVVFLFPLVLENKKYIRKTLFRIIIVLLLFAFSGRFVMKNISYDIYGVDSMHPYCFFFDDYSRHPGKTG